MRDPEGNNVEVVCHADPDAKPAPVKTAPPEEEREGEAEGQGEAANRRPRPRPKAKGQEAGRQEEAPLARSRRVRAKIREGVVRLVCPRRYRLPFHLVALISAVGWQACSSESLTKGPPTGIVTSGRGGTGGSGGGRGQRR